MTVDPRDYARRWKTLAVLSLSLVIIGLDNTILNVALPTLQDEFGASSSKLQWMVDSYLLVFAGLLLVFGTLGDRFGRKLALQAGVTIFGLASLGALVADSADQVIAVRAAMGVGAALIMPATLSIIANLFTGEERGKAIAIWAALAAVGIGLGPLTGGLLLEWFDWSSIFLVNVPVAALALLLGFRYVPESRDPRPGSFDLRERHSPPPASASSCTRSSRGPSAAGDPGWCSGHSRRASDCSARFSGGSAGPPSRCSTSASSAAPSFSVGTAAVSVAFFALLGGIFALTQYLQFAHGYSAIEAGAVMSPMALGLMIGAGSSSKAVRRLGRARVVAAGLSGIADGARTGDALGAAHLGTRAGRVDLRADPCDGLGHGPLHRCGRWRGVHRQVRRRIGHQHRRPHGLRRTRCGDHRLARQLARTRTTSRARWAVCLPRRKRAQRTRSAQPMRSRRTCHPTGQRRARDDRRCVRPCDGRRPPGRRCARRADGGRRRPLPPGPRVRDTEPREAPTPSHPLAQRRAA